MFEAGGRTLTFVCLAWEVRCFNTKYISTWTYENRVSKHFVVYLNFHCLSLYAVLSVDVGSFLGCFIIRDLCTSGCRQNFANFYLHIASVNIGGCPNESLMHDLKKLFNDWNLLRTNTSRLVLIIAIPDSNIQLFCERFNGTIPVNLYLSSGWRKWRFGEFKFKNCSPSPLPSHKSSFRRHSPLGSSLNLVL